MFSFALEVLENIICREKYMAFKIHEEPWKSWKSLIQSLYYSKTVSHIPSSYSRRKASPFWQNVLNVAPLMKSISTSVIKNGKSTSFWLNPWHSTAPFCSTYPSLFMVALNQNISVATFLAQSDWSLNFRLPLPSAGITKLLHLQEELNQVHLTTRNDCRRWIWSSTSSYSVSKCYGFLIHGGIISHFGQIIWKLPLLEKSKLLNWLCYHNKILT